MTYKVILNSATTSKWKINYETRFCKNDVIWNDPTPLLSTVYPEVIEVTRLNEQGLTCDFLFTFRDEPSYTLFLLKMEPRK